MARFLDRGWHGGNNGSIRFAQMVEFRILLKITTHPSIDDRYRPRHRLGNFVIIIRNHLRSFAQILTGTLTSRLDFSTFPPVDARR
jgi:hypothetical protein